MHIFPTLLDEICSLRCASHFSYTIGHHPAWNNPFFKRHVMDMQNEFVLAKHLRFSTVCIWHLICEFCLRIAKLACDSDGSLLYNLSFFSPTMYHRRTYRMLSSPTFSLPNTSVLSASHAERSRALRCGNIARSNNVVLVCQFCSAPSGVDTVLHSALGHPHSDANWIITNSFQCKCWSEWNGFFHLCTVARNFVVPRSVWLCVHAFGFWWFSAILRANQDVCHTTLRNGSNGCTETRPRHEHCVLPRTLFSWKLVMRHKFRQFDAHLRRIPNAPPRDIVVCWVVCQANGGDY